MRGTVVDEQTGRRVTVQSDCAGQPIFGGPWLVVGTCMGDGPMRIELYSLAAGTYRTVTFNGQLCTGDQAECDTVAVGADWVEVSETCYHCEASTVFQNLRSGAQQGPPGAGGTTMVDLSSPTLTSTVCSPLTVPGRGTLTFYGRFAVDGNPRSPAPSYLERCRSRVHLRLGPGTPVTGNRGMLIYAATVGATQWSGILLPSLHRFRLKLPSHLPFNMTSLVLSSHHLYAATSTGELWIAPTPRQPSHG